MAARFALAWRLHRAEIVAVALAMLGLSAVLLSMVPELDRIAATCRAATEVVAPCGGLREFGMIYDNDTQNTLAMIGPLVGALPFVAGVLLGAPLVAHELEAGTAQVSWSLARSRARWLAIRFLPLVVIGLALMVIPALAGEILERSLRPVIDPAASFEHYGARGPLLAVRFLPALAIAAVVGAVVGRQLPALLLAGAVVGGMAIGLMQTPVLWLQAQEQVEEFDSIENVGNLFAYVRYRDPDGTWISQEEAFSRMVTPEDEEPDPNQPQEVFFVIPGERYPEIVLRESLALLGMTAAAGGLLLFLVRRRRPG
jgi:putative exporter of polyketide antibiotics